MKKIMFNDKYGLTQAVLEDRKTMTRRIACKEIQKLMDASEKAILVIPLNVIPEGVSINELAEDWAKYDGQIIYKEKCEEIKPSVTKENASAMAIAHSPYKIGEEVAIAQSYSDLGIPFNRIVYHKPTKEQKEAGYLRSAKFCRDEAGWENKMFVKAELMPHRIRITDIKVKRIQSITEADAMREGIYKYNAAADAIGEDRYKFISYAYDATPGDHHKRWWFKTARDAFAALIDKVSGKGTWDSNPWVFAYEFELIK